MNHEKETIIENAIEEATATVEETIETVLEEVQAAVEDAVEEAVESVEHTDLAAPQVEQTEELEIKYAYAVGLDEMHPASGRALPYYKVGDSIAFTETQNGKEISIVYTATEVGGEVKYVLKK